MKNDLLRVIEAEARKERESILADALEQRSSILADAKRRAELAGGVSLFEGETRIGDAQDEQIKRWREISRRFAELHRRRSVEVGEAAKSLLVSLDANTRDSLLARVLREAFNKLPPGRYRLEAPPGVLRLFAQPSVPLELEAVPSESGHVTVSSSDGSLLLEWSLGGLMDKYMELFAQEVTGRMLGHDGD